MRDGWHSIHQPLTVSMMHDSLIFGFPSYFAFHLFVALSLKRLVTIWWKFHPEGKRPWRFQRCCIGKIARLFTRIARGPGGEIVVPLGRGCNYCAGLLSVSWLVGAHLWLRGPVVSRKDSIPGRWNTLRSSGRRSNQLSYLLEMVSE